MIKDIRARSDSFIASEWAKMRGKNLVLNGCQRGSLRVITAATAFQTLGSVVLADAQKRIVLWSNRFSSPSRRPSDLNSVRG